MTDLPPVPLTLAQVFLREGIPLTLLLDVHDPEGLKAALTAELLGSDVDLAPAPDLMTAMVRTA